MGKALQLNHTPEVRCEIDDVFDRMDATREMFAREDVRQDLDK